MLCVITYLISGDLRCVCLYECNYHTLQIQWIGWMERYGELSVDASMRYSDIIVPTLDTVRSSFLIELLLTNNKRVSVYNVLYVVLMKIV